eukprot:scaffold11145_cov42-Attheya_sp.AAC.2
MGQFVRMSVWMWGVVATAMICLVLPTSTTALTTITSFHRPTTRLVRTTSLSNAISKQDADEGDNEFGKTRGSGPNWIERCDSLENDETTPKKNVSFFNRRKKDDGRYALGISGTSFQTGSLSERMYRTLLQAAMKRFPSVDDIPHELLDIYKLYAMDFTAREACRAALEQNNMVMNVEEGKNDDVGAWGTITAVQVYLGDNKDDDDEEDEMEEYESLEQAIQEGDWQPGQTYNFEVTEIPAKLKDFDLGKLLQKLDPTGTMRSQAKDKGMTMPDEDLTSLQDLANDSVRRANIAPRDSDSDLPEDSLPFGGEPMAREDTVS